MESVEAAVRGTDLIVTVTSAREPIVKREWISDGAHLNVVGSSIATAREGAISPQHLRAELGEILTGRHPGRTSPPEITLFKSLGLAVEDLAAAQHLYRKAQERRVGTWVGF